MSDIFDKFTDDKNYINDNRSDHDEVYTLNLRVHCDKRVIDEFASFFPKRADMSLPVAVKWFLGGKLEFEMYLANASTNEHRDSVNLVLSGDSECKANNDLLSELDGMTLSVFGFNTDEWFYITKIKRVPRIVGSVSNRVIKSKITFFYNPSPNSENMPKRLLNRIFELPNIIEETKTINSRISHWDEYLKINEQIAEDAQLLLEYKMFFDSDNISRIVFEIGDADIKNSHINSDIQLVLETEYENGHPVYKGPAMGSVNSYDKKRGRLIVDMDYDFKEMLTEGRITVPKKGKLFISKWGDLVQIRRLRYGLQCFARGQAENPYLDVFLFDSAKARMPFEPGETLHTGNLLQANLNPEQKRAVEGVINSDDMYLIQGPPGTGKTTVIAEICYQNAIRGKKTLIASQTNLAVDNALGKLVHHPKIRALRKGNEESVQQEGKLFTENNVISAWLKKTSDDCVKQLEPRERRLDAANKAEEKLGFIESMYMTFNKATKDRNTNGIEKASLENKILNLNNKINWINDNIPLFVSDFDKSATKNLILNPYGADEEFLKLIALCYKTKHDEDEKTKGIKDILDDMAVSMRELQRDADSLIDEVKINNTKGEFVIKDEASFSPKLINFYDWQKEARYIYEAMEKIYFKKPSKLSRLFSANKAWVESAVEIIEIFYQFKSSSIYMANVQKQELDDISKSSPLKDYLKKLLSDAEALVSVWTDEVSELEKALSEVDNELEKCKKAILDSRNEIHEFNSDLPYQAKAEAIEIVCCEKDIKEYYVKLWKKAKDDDEKIIRFQSEWIKRLSGENKTDYKEFKQLYINSANVIGITCSQSGSKEFTHQYPTFDVAIIDEVSKATPPELILAVLKAKKIVLVGDHKQLPPMIGSDTYEELAKKLDISEENAKQMKLSLFEELFVKAPPQIKTMLSTQYRMHSQIMDGINQFYIEENNKGLSCGLDNPDEARKHMCHGKAIRESDHALWVDVPLFEENHEVRSDVNFSYSNKAECQCIRDILITINENLRNNGYEGKKKIGIISFYSNQVHLMENEFFDKEFAEKIDKLSLRIGSVDRFQGIECPVVICSFVRNNTKGEIGFAKDPRRVNVALSRAQELSIIVGCTELFCYSNNSPEASSIYKTITQNIFKAGGERSAWDFK